MQLTFGQIQSDPRILSEIGCYECKKKYGNKGLKTCPAF